MQRKFLLATIVFFSIFISGRTQSTAKDPVSSKSETKIKHRVVIQLSTGDTLAWLGAAHNIKNIRTALGDDVEIELVAHGAGIDFLVSAKTTQQQAITELKAKGVIFAACANSLRARNISKESIVPEAIVVPSGVTEVVLKQEEGWSYLKAGF